MAEVGPRRSKPKSLHAAEMSPKSSVPSADDSTGGRGGPTAHSHVLMRDETLESFQAPLSGVPPLQRSPRWPYCGSFCRWTATSSSASRGMLGRIECLSQCQLGDHIIWKKSKRSCSSCSAFRRRASSSSTSPPMLSSFRRGVSEYWVCPFALAVHVGLPGVE